MSSNFHPDGTLFIVSGPSGAGKTTLINAVREQLAEVHIQLYFSVSHTTRRPRTNEIPGQSYHFVEDVEFQTMVRHGEFLEYAHVHAHWYGTSRIEVVGRLQAGQDVILDIDYQGAKQIARDADLKPRSLSVFIFPPPLEHVERRREDEHAERPRLQAGQDVILDIDYQGAKQIARDADLKPRSLSVFIFPPSLDVLERRLRDRGLNTEAEIDLRLHKALDEIREGKDFYDYIIINDNLKVATECLKAAVIAKKLQTKTALEAISAMAERFNEEDLHGRTARRG